jgi:hypothetical protein
VQPVRELQVDADTRRKPKVVARLNDWQYVERSIHRLIAAWGRNFAEWEDKVACHRHIWEQAECVRRLRERIVQFPGSVNNVDAPVSARLEKLGNTVLLAPSFEDAVDGIYQFLSGALTMSYLRYAQSAHPVHDAPTVAMLHEIITVKEGMRLWLRDYRRRNPHTIDAAYRAAVEREIEACGNLLQALPVEGEPAAPVGVNTDFRLRKYPARPKNSQRRHDIMPLIKADFKDSIETRRLFWCYAYMLEMNLAVDQLRWIYDGHYMPWEFLQDISRHLWDESRHGDSGHSRLLDFGLSIGDVGFCSYDQEEEEALAADPSAVPTVESLSPRSLYMTVYNIGMVAETGHFHVKNEAYEDFKAGDDLESAEMMLFDIIDESTHVQYAHRWLPLLAQHAKIDNSDYRERAVQERARIQRELEERIASTEVPRDAADANYAHYQKLLGIMRAKQPLSQCRNLPLALTVADVSCIQLAVRLRCEYSS